MRIKEFVIDEYGPLKGTGRVKVGGFNLFYGRNENGKTLTIDALIKFLIGKRAKDFKQTDRVDENPEGSLTLAFNGADAEKILPTDGDLSKVTRSLSAPLSSSDCRNIFIIRNSELSLAGEAMFYTGMTERLVGLRTSDLKKIKKNLLDIGKLTPALGFKDDEKSFRLKGRLTKALLLIDRIEAVKNRLLQGNYDQLEMDLYKKTKELSNVNERISILEDARNRGLFEKSNELLHTLENKVVELKGLELYRDEDYQIWQDSEREMRRNESEKKDIVEKAIGIKNEIVVVSGKINEIKYRLDFLDKRKFQLENEKLRLRGLENNLLANRSNYRLGIIFKRISIISSIVLLSIISVWFFITSIFIYIAGIISLIITILLWGNEIYIALKNKKVQKEFDEIKLNMAEMGISGENIENLLNALGVFHEEFDNIKNRFMETESHNNSLNRHLKECEEKVSGYTQSIDNMDKKILSVKTKCGFLSLQQYSEILSKKRENEKQRDSIASRLAGMLEVHGRSLGDTINLCRSKIEDLESYNDKGIGVEFNQKNYNDLRQRSIELEDALRDIKEKINLVNTELSKIESSANDIFVNSDERLYCKTLIDLDELLKRLKKIVEENNNRRDAIKEVLHILNEIEMSEKERVLELFDNGAPVSVSKIYNIITDNHYEEVIYDREAECLKVRRDNGEIIDADKLSGGAYDQLYLSIRLALGEKLLQDEKGFFIMDDPFIKSDIERIKTQMNVLKKVISMGWQILYFTCKNEIKDVLSDDINNGKVNFVDINWVN